MAAKKAKKPRSTAQVAAQKNAAKASAAARSKRAASIKKLTEPLHMAKQMGPSAGRTRSQQLASIDSQIASIRSNFKGTKEYKAKNAGAAVPKAHKREAPRKANVSKPVPPAGMSKKAATAEFRAEGAASSARLERMMTRRARKF